MDEKEKARKEKKQKISLINFHTFVYMHRSMTTSCGEKSKTKKHTINPANPFKVPSETIFHAPPNSSTSTRR